MMDRQIGTSKLLILIQTEVTYFIDDSVNDIVCAQSINHRQQSPDKLGHKGNISQSPQRAGAKNTRSNGVEQLTNLLRVS
jgi:hypothetical protein